MFYPINCVAFFSSILVSYMSYFNLFSQLMSYPIRRILCVFEIFYLMSYPVLCPDAIAVSSSVPCPMFNPIQFPTLASFRSYQRSNAISPQGL